VCGARAADDSAFHRKGPAPWLQPIKIAGPALDPTQNALFETTRRRVFFRRIALHLPRAGLCGSDRQARSDRSPAGVVAEFFRPLLSHGRASAGPDTCRFCRVDQGDRALGRARAFAEGIRSTSMGRKISSSWQSKAALQCGSLRRWACWGSVSARKYGAQDSVQSSNSITTNFSRTRNKFDQIMFASVKQGVGTWGAVAVGG